MDGKIGLPVAVELVVRNAIRPSTGLLKIPVSNVSPPPGKQTRQANADGNKLHA